MLVVRVVLGIAISIWSHRFWERPMTHEEPPVVEQKTVEEGTKPDSPYIAIREVERMVQMRDSDTSPWLRAIQGMRLKEGSSIRLGPRSKVVVELGVNQTRTLDRLGTLKVVKDAGKLRFEPDIFDEKLFPRRSRTTSRPTSVLMVR